MAGLHIVVCMKVVPKSEEVTVNAETRTLDRSRARSEFNGPDMNALEAGLQLKGAHGGRISLLSMGPPFCEPYLRLGLAMGADAAFLMSDRVFGGADTLATSYTLARGVSAIGKVAGEVDLVLCGEESSDGATGQVPPGIAEWLNVPQLTYASHLDVVARRRVLRARRELGSGFEIVEAPLPCVVSLKSGCNEPRFLDLQRWDWAMGGAPVTVWTAGDMDFDRSCLGLDGSPTIVAGVSAASAATRRRELLSGTPQQEAEKLSELLRPLLPA